ncbi:MAG: hypothetical protein A2632_02030 [Candidatus Pacebacteria bacterium RIFCSPHIGHO2_01_FULL_46_16]|nr:MAG: hypothetical protein A2632_02030 [Candidatus Pacebacteria bacterium RIFCSPHIGHO2_01_FULL_46_16]OGJ37379.1 MAG: hypothetical protein A3A82_02630 [Candidatus Pacebacteria bacterium RIFCSPLOWO2_01_FULL_47_12]
MRTLRTTIAKLTLLGLLAGAFFFLKLGTNLIWFPLLEFSLGLLLGAGLLKFDKVVLAPRYQDEAHTFIFTRSFLFIISFAAVSLWIVTSSGSLVGNGLALGIAGSLLIEMTHLRLDAEVFHQTFFAQINKRYTQADINHFVLLAWGYYLLLVGLVFRP